MAGSFRDIIGLIRYRELHHELREHGLREVSHPRFGLDELLAVESRLALPKTPVSRPGVLFSWGRFGDGLLSRIRARFGLCMPIFGPLSADVACGPLWPAPPSHHRVGGVESLLGSFPTLSQRVPDQPPLPHRPPVIIHIG